MLHLLILSPLLSILLLIFLRTQNQLRVLSALSGAFQLGLTIFLLFEYFSLKKAAGLGQLIYESTYAWFPSLGIQYHTGVDGISISMILLTSIVLFTGILVSWKINELTKEFFVLLQLLAAGAYGFFMSQNLFMAFFFLEMAVIPKFLLIGTWGSGRKEYSAMKLTLMLTTGSALLLVGILGIYYLSAGTGEPTFEIGSIMKNGIPMQAQRFLFPIMFTGFGIFTAMFPFHVWAPDGHSSAPTAGSMFLAGISMKLGGYGCLRFATFLMPEASNEIGWIFIILAVIGVVYGSFVTLRQTDIKYINAYSSVSHCALVILGILMMTRASMTGAVLQMFSHGVMTALFFAVIGMIYYRTHTREMYEMGGLLKPMPFLGTIYIIAGLCSLGLPGLSGFVAEANIFFGSFEKADLFYRICTILAVTSIVVTAVYILRAIGQFLLGPVKNEMFAKVKDAAWYEKLSAGLLVVVIVAVGTMPFWLTEMVHDGINPVMDHITSVTMHATRDISQLK